MLLSLHLRNLAVAEDLAVDFGPGLTVITGETGAGKSLLVGALALLAGSRAQSEHIRTGCDEALAEAVFSLAGKANEALRARLLELDYAAEEDEQLLVRRVISTKAHRNKVFLNGNLATVSLLKEIVGGLLDISGQHDHQLLLRPEAHLELLDGYGDHGHLRDAYSKRFAALRQTAAQMAEVAADDEERERQIAFLRFQLDEIEEIGPRQGEEEELKEERDRLAHVEKLRQDGLEAEGALYSEGGAATEKIGRALDSLRPMARIDTSLEAHLEMLDTAQTQVEEVARGLQRYLSKLEADPNRLDQLEERLHQLKRLMRKHGGTLEGVLSSAQRFETELHRLENSEAHRADLEKRWAQEGREALAAAGALSHARRQTASRFAKAMEEELSHLAMGGSVVRLKLSPLRAGPSTVEVEADLLGASGLESCEILISPNLGEEPRALQKIASGGELSRVMLAAKCILAEGDPVPTYLFDEVDSGISGETADRVGERIEGVARFHQVICITHLAGIATRDGQHLVVRKEVHKGKTRTKVLRLAEQDRVEEIARLLGGSKRSKQVRLTAAELLHAHGSRAGKAAAS